MKVIVVGAGSFGSWSAWKLLKAGFDVTLIDAWGPGHSRSSSGGETRVIRTVYGQDEQYIDMARRAITQWDEFQRRVDQPLMTMTGSLWLCGSDDSYVQAARERMAARGIELEELNLGTAAQRWPQICFDGLEKVFHERLSGFLRARKACATVVEDFVRQGGDFRIAAATPPATDSRCHQIKLLSGEILKGDEFVFSAGPWMKNLLPEVLGEHIQVSRQEVYYFGTPQGTSQFHAGHLPIWLELNEPIYYGLPSIDDRGFKVARDERGAVFDPESEDRTATPGLVHEARMYLKQRFPELANAPLVESRVCQYSNSPDGHFFLDRHQPSNLILAGGGSGHGFKMGPEIGDLVVQLIQENKSIPEFGLQRLTHKQQNSTQFDHS